MDILGEIGETLKWLVKRNNNNFPRDFFLPVKAKCLDCDEDFKTSFGGVPCPKCGSQNVHLDVFL